MYVYRSNLPGSPLSKPLALPSSSPKRRASPLPLSRRRCFRSTCCCCDGDLQPCFAKAQGCLHNVICCHKELTGLRKEINASSLQREDYCCPKKGRLHIFFIWHMFSTKHPYDTSLFYFFLLKKWSKNATKHL